MPELGFIMAASHSGSTLLAMLLGSHPQASTVGDTGGTSHRKNPEYRCSCGSRAKECSFWREVKDQMAIQGFDLDITDFKTRFIYPENGFINRVLNAEYRGPVFEIVRDMVLRLNMGWRRQARTIAERNVALIETVNRITNSKILIDSSKHLLRVKFLLRIPGLKTKISQMRLKIKDHDVSVSRADKGSFGHRTEKPVEDLNVGDELFVEFRLDDAKRTLIEKEVIVRWVNMPYIGVEFTSQSLYDGALGFYMMG